MRFADRTGKRQLRKFLLNQKMRIQFALELVRKRYVLKGSSRLENISVNALNESPTLSLHSPRSKKARHFVIESDSD